MNTENIYKVHEVTSHIKLVLERNLDYLQIVGEVSNISFPASGHIYFSLKDEKALIRCVFFAGFNRALLYVPKNGDNVVVSGKITVYERDGQYQIIVTNVSQYGIGQLHERFEKLKEKLKLEGLFDDASKKQLPKYPNAIGIITSESGAVIQDMLNILARRYPLNVYLYPAIVQGSEAACSLVKGINYFIEKTKTKQKVDLIIIGRGGGSFEDLFCFNDEELARAIFKCSIPVISAVGHETDFTICDFVADVRASTPSVAIELAVPDKNDVLTDLQNKKRQMNAYINSMIQEKKQTVLLYDKRMKESHPIKIIYKYQQQIDDYTQRLQRINIENVLANKNSLLKTQTMKINYIIRDKLNTISNDINIKTNILEGLSPKKIMEKGYTMINKDGKIVKSKLNLTNNDKIEIIFKDGSCKAGIINNEI